MARPLRGFTLVEILITVFVLGATAALFTSALTTLALTNNLMNQDVALRIATQQLEDMRAAGYSSIPGSGTFVNSLSSTLPSPTLVMTVSDFNAKTKKVAVSVSWQETGEPTRAVSLSTLVTDAGGL